LRHFAEEPVRQLTVSSRRSSALLVRSLVMPPRARTTTPCGFSQVVFDPPDIALPALISLERVRGAGVLMLAHLYGTRLRFFEAVEQARQLLDTDDLCFDDPDLLDRLYCYPECRHRVGPDERALLAAKVLGVPHPDVPENLRDPLIQGLLTRLLDAVNDVCDPRHPSSGPTPAQVQRVVSAALAVQTRLSWSMAGLITLQVRDLQEQLATAQGLLTDLADYLRVPCRPGGAGADIWGSVSVLVGERLRADGIDVFEFAEQARAWRVIFNALDGPAGGVPSVATICEAAALLRPSPPDRGCKPCEPR
jgi:hypothetical protein